MKTIKELNDYCIRLNKALLIDYRNKTIKGFVSRGFNLEKYNAVKIMEHLKYKLSIDINSIIIYDRI